MVAAYVVHLARHDARFGAEQFRATMTLPVLLQGETSSQLPQQLLSAPD